MTTFAFIPFESGSIIDPYSQIAASWLCGDQRTPSCVEKESGVVLNNLTPTTESKFI